MCAASAAKIRVVSAIRNSSSQIALFEFLKCHSHTVVVVNFKRTRHKKEIGKESEKQLLPWLSAVELHLRGSVE